MLGDGVRHLYSGLGNLRRQRKNVAGELIGIAYLPGKFLIPNFPVDLHHEGVKGETRFGCDKPELDVLRETKAEGPCGALLHAGGIHLGARRLGITLCLCTRLFRLAGQVKVVRHTFA